MSVAPWYISTGSAPSLKHQKAPLYNDDPNKLNHRFDRGAKQSTRATTFRKGACTNCGALSHALRDCLERPRKVGAKFTGKDIAHDEVIHDDRAGLNGMEGMGDYDAKRDRWDGYDPANHKAVVLEYEALEEARRKLREEAIDKGSAVDEKAVKKAAKLGKGSKKKQKQDEDDFGTDSDSDAEAAGGGDDDDKYAEGADVAGQRMDAKTRVTVRNLRIREDTAKYLMNLDLESAYYDPKTRSMREAPEANVKPEDVRLLFLLVSTFAESRAMTGRICWRQLCSSFWRSQRSTTTATLRLAIRATRKRRSHQLQPDSIPSRPQGIPREEDRHEG